MQKREPKRQKPSKCAEIGREIVWIAVLVIALGIILAIVSALCGTAKAAMTDCIDATCRITAADGGVGSGCVFEIGDGRVFVLTAAHVVGNDTAVRCEFWRQGHQSRAISGQVIARSEAADAAVVAVPEAAFEGILPGVVPFAPRDFAVPAGATLSSVGCANGSWSTGWKGHALGYSDGDLHFVPTPANGRSGSAIFDADGKIIVAVLRARTANDSEGIATPVKTIYDAFTTKTQSKPEWRESACETPAQCPGGTCPGGSCPGGVCPMQGGSQPSPAPYLLPYRYREQFRNQPGGSPPSKPGTASPAWPTLPGGNSASADLGPTNEKLDRIADMLGVLIQSKPADAVDDKARKQADDAAKAATDAKTAADKAATAAADAGTQVKNLADQTLGVVGEVKKVGGVIERFGGDPETLIQRALDRVSKVKTELGPNAEPDDVVKGYLKDLAREKLKEGLAGGLTFDKLVSIGGGIPAVCLAIFGCVIVWKLVNNKPLAIEGIAPNSLAAQAASQIREHVSAAVEPIKAQIEAKLGQISGVAANAQAAADVAKTVSQIAATTAGQAGTQAAAK
jgi:hypothetical protein